MAIKAADKIKTYLAVAAGLLVVAMLIFTCAGGWDWVARRAAERKEAGKPPPDPLSALSDWCACADGTYYLSQGSSVYWVVEDRASPVQIDDEFFIVAHLRADTRGGAYAKGMKHLWYLKKGVAKLVREGPATAPDQDEKVTRSSLLWSVMQRWGNAAYEAGLDDRGASTGGGGAE